MAIKRELTKLQKKNKIEIVLDGAARGADSLGHKVAVELGLKTKRYPANWLAYGKSAGPYRNQKMLAEGQPTIVLAFHSDIENSKGTKDMIARAKKVKVKVKLFVE